MARVHEAGRAGGVLISVRARHRLQVVPAVQDQDQQ